MSNLLYSIFLSVSMEYGVPTELLMAICKVESSFDVTAINYNDGGSDAHSFGLCQVQYTTARDLGYRKDKRCKGEHLNKCGLLNPETNIRYAAKYLSYQLTRYDNDKTKAISAYNAGSYTRKNKHYLRKVFKALTEVSNEQ